MFKYTIKRVLQSLGTVLIVVSIVSLLLSLMPTDYFFTEEQLIKLTDKQKEDQLAAAGLLDSPIVQLFRFLENLILKFDIGTYLNEIGLYRFGHFADTWRAYGHTSGKT